MIGIATVLWSTLRTSQRERFSWVRGILTQPVATHREDPGHGEQEDSTPELGKWLPAPEVPWVSTDLSHGGGL